MSKIISLLSRVPGCIGCKTYYLCSIQLVTGKECPCTTCLVKAMCIESCGELNRFRMEEFHYRRRKEKKKGGEV